MEPWVITIINIIVAAIISTTIGLLLKHSFSKFINKKEQEEQLRKEKDERLEELECANEMEELRSMIVSAIEEAIAPLKHDITIIKKGTQAGLRHDLSLMADEWLKKGYCPRNIKTDFEQLYTQYHLLGKNGVMDSTYKAILDLPEVKTTLKKKEITKKN